MIFEAVIRFVDDLLTTIFTEVKMNNRTDQRVTVFVYGKLQKGESNHGYLASAQYLGPALSIDPLSMFIDLDTSIPVVTEQPTTFISGELYLLPDARALAQIDSLEGHPDSYQRKLILVDQSRRVHKAWCYLFHHELDSAHVFLNTGNYKDRRLVKKTIPSVRADWESAWAA